MYEQEIELIRDEQAVLVQKSDDARDEGFQIGQERGGKAEKIEVAKAILAINMDTISKLTGLPISEIEKLKKESIF